MPKTIRQKILFIITKANFGGAQKYVFDLATSLPRTEFEAVVAFGEGDELEDKLEKAGIRTIRIDSLKRDISLVNDAAVLLELIRIFKDEQPDVVHLNSTKIGGVGGVAGRLCRIKKIIFTAHGWAFNEKRNFISKTVIAFLQWLTVMLSHTTIAVSNGTADQILSFPFVRRKIKVIHNGVESAVEAGFLGSTEARRALQEKIATNAAPGAPTIGSKWIGTISELHTNKGLDIAVSAFSKIADDHQNSYFVIIGEGEERAALTQQINRLGLGDRVFLCGFLHDAKKYLKAFDIFTLTSRTEAFPYVILEAGLAERPVIASSVGGIPEAIRSLQTGILIPKNENSVLNIAETLEYLLNHPDKAGELGHNLKIHVEREYSQKNMRAETFALYR